MKKIYTILVAVLITASVFAQAPEKMSYQAVIRNSSDQLITNQAIGMQISILQTTATGTAVYVETHSTTTNTNGLVTVEIGNGIVVSGDFTAIDWANDVYFIKTETDPTTSGGTAYTITGISQLMSVVYALHAKTAESIEGGISETDPVFTVSQASNITGTDITNLSNLSNTNTGDQDLSGIAINTQAIQDSASQIRADIPNVSGFLTSETDPAFTAWDKDYADIINPPTTITTAQAGEITANTAKNTYPTADATKLAGIEAGAEVNVNADWSATTGDAQIQNKPTLATVATSGSYNDLSDQPTIPAAADGSETIITAGTNVTVTGAGTTVSPYVVNATNATSLTIGQSYQGGIIFWLDATGQHGLIAATADQSTGIQWYNGTYTVTNAVRDGIGAGMYNTERIIANQSTGSYAAQLCANYQGGEYGDWYLPSKYELNLLYLQKAAVGGFASAWYWSSTEYNNYNAWLQFFGDGSQSYGNKVGTNYVRAIRAF